MWEGKFRTWNKGKKSSGITVEKFSQDNLLKNL